MPPEHTHVYTIFTGDLTGPSFVSWDGRLPIQMRKAGLDKAQHGTCKAKATCLAAYVSRMLREAWIDQVKGYVEKEGRKQSFPQLHGTWDGAFSATWEDGSQQLLWQKNPPHEHPSR